MAATEKSTLQLPGMPKKMGRPVTGKALTNAERQARYRAWSKLQHDEDLKRAAMVCGDLADRVLLEWMDSSLEFPDAAKSAWLEVGKRRGWLK